MKPKLSKKQLNVLSNMLKDKSYNDYAYVRYYGSCLFQFVSVDGSTRMQEISKDGHMSAPEYDTLTLQDVNNMLGI